MVEEALKKGYAEYSNSGLLALHSGVARACESDHSMSTAQKEVAQNYGSPLNYYGVDEFPDWRMHGNALEAVLIERGIEFVPIVF